MLVKSRSEHLTDSRGKSFSIYQPLVSPGTSPSGGWGSSIVLNGTKLYLNGARPNDVVSSLESLLSHNKIPFTKNEVWSTLNIDWLRRCLPQYQIIGYATFVRQCEVTHGTEDFRGKSDLTDWLPNSLNFIGFYLSVNKDSYSYDEFFSIVKTVTRMSDQRVFYRLGDHSVHSSLLEKLTEIRYSPCHLLEEAQDWFVSVFNSLCDKVNLTPTDKRKATNKYHWNNGTKD